MGRGSRGSCTQRCTVFDREIPGQERLDVFRCPPASRRTTLQVPPQPRSRIEFPMGQRGQQQKHRRGPPATRQGTPAVEILPHDGRAAAHVFRGVIVHRNTRVIHKPRQSHPVLLQAFQNLAARLAEFEIGRFSRRFVAYRLHRLTQQDILLLNLR